MAPVTATIMAMGTAMATIIGNVAQGRQQDWRPFLFGLQEHQAGPEFLYGPDSYMRILR